MAHSTSNSLFRITMVLYLCLFLIPDDATGIWCFQCNSGVHSDCADIKPNDTTSVHYKECTGKEVEGKTEIFCRKLVQTIFDREGLVRVVRSCGWILNTNGDCYTTSSAGRQEISCQCFTDGCNSASNMESYFIVILSSLSVLFMKYI